MLYWTNNKIARDSFTSRVLIICFDDAVHLIEKEYILKYHAQVPNGYNILPGGQLGDGFLGKNHSDNSIVKIKESQKKFREEHPNHFETYREKLKESMKKVDISKCTKESEKFQKAVRERLAKLKRNEGKIWIFSDYSGCSKGSNNYYRY